MTIMLIVTIGQYFVLRQAPSITSQFQGAIMPNEPKYWFPAKRYGWGWGPPSSWEGWVVFVLPFQG